jgi:hypothetical protein
VEYKEIIPIPAPTTSSLEPVPVIARQETPREDKRLNIHVSDPGEALICDSCQ